MNKRKIVFWSVLGVVILALVITLLCFLFPNNSVGKVNYIGHRGYSCANVDNTLEAFIEGGSKDFWGLECDVRVTSDGEFVLSHDKDPFKSLGDDRTVESMTYEEVMSKPLPNKFNDKLVYICNFADYLGACKAYKKIAVIELKSNFTKAQLESMLEIIEDKYSLDKVQIIAFNIDLLDEIRLLNPKVSLVGLAGSPKGIDNVFKKGYDISVKSYWLSRSIVAKFNATGRTVSVWTVDSRLLAGFYTRWGVVAITSNCLDGK